MLDVVVFGATGHTGRLVTRALERRRARFALAGRDRARLEALAEEHGAASVHVAAAGDVDSVAEAAAVARVLLSCVGPFARLGDTAVEAALAAGVDYADSSGEARFVSRLRARYDHDARAAGITLAPALAFDEVPADVAATRATAGMSGADLTLTYALPSTASRGTALSALDIMTTPGTWLVDGVERDVVTGSKARWAPMPPPLGVRPSFAAHMAEAQLAPLHLDVASVSTFLTTSTARLRLLRVGLPAVRIAARRPALRRALEAALLRAVSAPSSESARAARWTVLAEATTGTTARNVVVTGDDVYGLSGELLAAGALAIARAGAPKGLVSPVAAVGIDRLEQELTARGVRIETLEPR